MAANYTIKESITMALIRLMDTQPYEKITVTDIVRKSGVCRASFYRNYADKEDVLRNYIKFAMKNCPEYYSDPADADATQLVCGMCKTIRENRMLFDALKKNHLLHLMQEQILTMLLDYLSRHQLRISHYEIAFFSHATLGILLEWINSGYPETEEELTRLYFRLLRREG